MSPIRITSKLPVVHIYVGEREVATVQPNSDDYYDVDRNKDTVTVQPENGGSDSSVIVNGYRDKPGGTIRSRRLSSGRDEDEYILTTPDDPELSAELGVSEVVVDGVIYTAINPSQK